jgi:hypothetical protein
VRVRVSLSTAHAHEVHTLGSPDTFARACACGETTLLRAAAATPAAATAALGQPRSPWPPTNSDQGSLAALWGLPLAASRHRGVWATWLPLPRLLLRSNWHSSRRSEAATERAMSGSHSRADAPAGSQASNARPHTAVSCHQNIGSVAIAQVFATSDALRHESPVRPAASDTAPSAGSLRPQAREHQFISKWGTYLAPGQTLEIQELEGTRSNSSKSAGHSFLQLPLRLPGPRVLPRSSRLPCGLVVQSPARTRTGPTLCSEASVRRLFGFGTAAKACGPTATSPAGRSSPSPGLG